MHRAPLWLTKATARELASRGITCNAVAPGFVLTELTKDLPDALQAEITSRTPLGRFGTTDEIAKTLVLSPETVRSHLKNLYRKLEVNSREDAVQAASRLRGLSGLTA